MAFSILRGALSAAILGAVTCAAAAQDRRELPVTVEAHSTDFDYRSNVLVFNDVTIIQGATRITAERAEASGLDFEDSGWEFSGSVHITMSDGGLASDTARVRFAGGEIQSASVSGAPATFEQHRDARLAQGRAQRIDYDLGRGTVELAGDAWLSDGRNEITGATLVYSTESQRVISREQVTITIKPREQPDAPKNPE
jgi:lipopolysaccharide transport protein LptA